MESINPVDNPVGMPRSSMKAQDSQPERREDSKLRVVLARSLSNSTPSALTRALSAYHRLDLAEMKDDRLPRTPTKSAIRLTARQIALLVEHYRSGATAQELAVEFGVHRTTVAQQVKRSGLAVRLYSPSGAAIEEMVKLYISGLSLDAVGSQLGFSGDTVRKYILLSGVQTRDSHGRNRV